MDVTDEMIESPDESLMGEGGIHRLAVDVECLIHLNRVNAVFEVSLEHFPDV